MCFNFSAQFIEDIQKVMGIPEWMLSVDSRKTRTLHYGACVQFLLHFKGPIASRLEQDFSRLIASGRLDAPSLYIPGKLFLIFEVLKEQENFKLQQLTIFPFKYISESF